MYEVSTKDVELFEFSVDGQVYSLPQFKHLPVTELREYTHAIADAGDQPALAALDAAMAIFERHCPGAMDAMTGEQVGGLINAYMAEQEPGESTPSSD